MIEDHLPPSARHRTTGGTASVERIDLTLPARSSPFHVAAVRAYAEIPLPTISEKKGRVMADDQEVLTVKDVCDLLSGGQPVGPCTRGLGHVEQVLAADGMLLIYIDNLKLIGHIKSSMD
jgi:hypothetical protein